MAKFRNRLVHLYWEIDPETVYQLLQDNLDDFVLFQQKVVSFLNQNKLPFVNREAWGVIREAEEKERQAQSR